MIRTVLSCLLLGALPSVPASAFIVAGANGGANNSNNTTASQLDLAVSNPFPYFNNIISEGSGSGIYLGFSPGDKTVYVLSSRHFDAGNAAPISIGGLDYPLISNQIISNSDLRVLSYRRGDLQVPNLPAISLATAGPTLNLDVVMIGNGVQRIENATVDANTSDATNFGSETGYDWMGAGSRITRWGTNRVDLLNGNPFNGIVNTLNLGSYTTQAWSADFDQPAAGQWLSSNEAMASVNDSGGGAFWFVSGEWVLGGVTTGVDPTSAAQTASLFTSGADGAYRGTFFTNVSTYEGDISALTGALIPEPSSLWLALLGGLLALRRRRA